MNFKQLKDFDFKNIDLKNIEIDRNYYSLRIVLVFSDYKNTALYQG